MLGGLFKKTKYITVSTKALNKKEDNAQKPNIPNGMWVKCNKCGQIIYKEDLEKNHMVCNFCKYHFRLNAFDRIEQIVDEDTFEELNSNITSKNPISFKGYEEKVSKLKKETGLKDAVITGKGKINGEDSIVCVMDSNFMMGSMGSVVGEKITLAVEKAIEDRVPIVIFTTSGGARMQEGMFSLMQMAKVSAAIAKLNKEGLLYITVLTDPTTGGVTASFAMLGDVIISEKGALVGFAGKRVIEQTIKQKLPDEFQSAEFLLEHGFIDKIVERKDLKNTLSLILKAHRNNSFSKINKDSNSNIDIIKNVKDIKNKKAKLSAWEKLNMVRAKERPTALDYIERVFDSFIEFHGDRYFGDDGCVVGGIAFLNNKPVTVIAQQKGRDVKENVKRNFGMPNPEGYRKALRLMKQAEKFNRPVICFVDTPGAFCGIGAEERGQGEAIAKNLMEMSTLKTPIISMVIGEGGSGGALALAVADEVWMLENAIYSVLSPEGFASILWKDSSRVKEAAELIKITAQDLKKFGIIDRIINEPHGDAHKDLEKMSANIKENIIEALSKLDCLSVEELVSNRYDKFRKIGEYNI